MNKSSDEIEQIFRNSNSPDELFDAFRGAITLKISDIELYKILLANPILSKEELKMYSEHLSKVFYEKAFDIFMWTGNIFSNYNAEYERLEDSITYYVKALYSNPKNHEPFCRLLQLYNYDLNVPANKIIIEIVETCIDKAEKKSIIYAEMSKLFEKAGMKEKSVEYIKLAQKYQREDS